MAIRLISTSAEAGTATDTVDWAQYGGDGTPLPMTVVASGGNSFARIGGTSVSGRVTFELTTKKSGLLRLTQDQLASGPVSWFGNFTPPEPVLFANKTPGPLSLKFDQPIRGIWLQVDLDDEASQVQRGISVFNASDNPIALPQMGTRTSPAHGNNCDGSAPFIGALDDVARISRAVISVTVLDHAHGGDQTFAINALKLVL